MRKRFYLAVIVLAILLLALGGMVFRSTATAVRTISGLFDRRVRWAILDRHCPVDKNRAASGKEEPMTRRHRPLRNAWRRRSRLVDSAAATADDCAGLYKATSSGGRR